MRNQIVKNLLLAGVILAGFYGCEESSRLVDPMDGSGRIVSQTRIADECDGIALRYAGNVIVTQGDSQEIRVEADDNIIDDVVTHARNGILEVGLQDGSYSNVTVRIYVTLKRINSINLNGAGNITVNNQLESNSLDCMINGAGNVILRGNANSSNCIINGAGNINAFSLSLKTCTAKVNGTGDCSVNVSDELDAAISGVGNIVYDGNPKVVKSSVSGMGKISRR